MKTFKIILVLTLLSLMTACGTTGQTKSLNSLKIGDAAITTNSAALVLEQNCDDCDALVAATKTIATGTARIEAKKVIKRGGLK